MSNRSLANSMSGISFCLSLVANSYGMGSVLLEVHRCAEEHTPISIVSANGHEVQYVLISLIWQREVVFVL